MKIGRLILAFAVAARLLDMAPQAHAQTALAVSSCGAATYSAGQQYPTQQTTTGNLCTSGSGGGGSSNATIVAPLGSQTQAASVATTINGALPAGSNIIGTVDIDQTTPGTTNGVTIAPSSAAGVAITPVNSSSAENNHVLKNAAGNLYSAYATNLTSTAGFLEVFNATSAPSDGAVTPVDCVALPPTGTASIARSPGPPRRYSTGITAVVSSASTCFTKTTGTITAFFSGDVQ